MKNVLNKIDKLYTNFCIKIYFGLLNIFKLDYFLLHNINQ